MQGVKSNISFPNGIRVKSRKYVGPGCSPAPSDVKDNLPVMLVISLFIYQLFCLNVNTIYKLIILHNTHVIFLGYTLLALYLFAAHPCFLFFRQVLQKPLKFVNNVLQTNERFLNESNFRSFLSLCTFILGNRLRKR